MLAKCIFFAMMITSTSASFAEVYVDSPDPLPSENPPDPGFTWFVNYQAAFDSNLYRLPDSFPAFSTPGAGITIRSDHIETTTFLATDYWVSGEQGVMTSVAASYNLYLTNKYLNNFSNNEHLLWDWKAGALLSGQVGIVHDSSLLDFAYSRVFAKDIIDSTKYFGNGDLQLSPDWIITAGVHQDVINHSLSESVAQNSRSQSGSVGLEFIPSETSSLELQYRYVRDMFPDQITNLNSAAQDFHESTPYVLFNYAPSDKTNLVANAGYLHRVYIDEGLPAYSGDVWHASFRWRAFEKLEVASAIGRDLNAYIDAASDYFISKTVSIRLKWTPRDKLAFSMGSSWEHQEYAIGAKVTRGIAGRVDEIRSENLIATYSPRVWISLSASAGLTKRESTDPLFSFNDHLIALDAKIQF
jgi:hypothetical protein